MFLRRPLQPEDVAAGRRVVQAIAHRGPDGEGEWMDVNQGVYFGHRRLSIIDLSHASDQPLVRDGHALIFNGELYNFRVLRSQLETADVAFSSQGDAEVFLRGWQRWGDDVLPRVDGMFAVGYWDGHKGKLAVDAFGEKPLFVAETEDGVFACSEIAPLADLLRLAPALTPAQWTTYLSLGFVPQPTTFYPGIEMMPPATCREVHQGRLGPPRKFWAPPPVDVRTGRPRPPSERDLDALVEALVESLRYRLIADVPLALFLSAGVDSALVAALCRHEVQQDVECLTVSFSGREVRDESEAAGRIARHLGFSHRILASNPSVPVRRLLELLGQPNGTVGALPLEQICAAARSAGFKAALTGMGGDEVTAGYAKHVLLWRRRRIAMTPRLLRRGSAAVLRHFGSRLEGLAGLIAADPMEMYLAVKNYPALFWLRSLPGYRPWVTSEFGQDSAPPEIAVPRYELTRVMPAVHLYTADHASMRHALELRTPFLNRRVVEVIAGWDARSLVGFGQKSILRRILARYLPASLTDHPKTGLSFPRQPLLAGQSPRGLPGLPDHAVEACWSRRERGGGWAAIAVRMRAAEWFFKNRDGMARDD